MKPIKLIFFGTPQSAADILKFILSRPKSFIVSAVVTQPDKPQGRKKTLTPSPVAQLANKANLPLFKPKKLDRANLEHLKLLPADIFLVVAYGQIFPSAWLKIPKIATVNIHFSLLPKYRGALCVSEAIKNQDQQTGVTLMKMDEQLDHGHIIAQTKQKISLNDNVATLTQKLTQKTISLLNKVQPCIKVQPLKTYPQDHRRASYTPSLKTRTRQSAFIKNLASGNPQKLHALIRSLNPDPGAWTKINGQELKIIKTKLEKNELKITRVQLPGKKPISWQQFLNGHPVNQIQTNYQTKTPLPLQSP